MKCINRHRNWAKLQLMPQSLSLMFPFTTLCWWYGSTPTTSITKLESAKCSYQCSYFIADAEEMCKRCFTLVLPPGCFIFPYSFYDDKYLHGPWAVFSMVKEILCQELVRIALHNGNNNSTSAQQQTHNDQHQYFIAFQSQTSYLMACQSMLITWWSNSDLLL